MNIQNTVSSLSVMLVSCAIGHTHQLVSWRLKSKGWPKAVNRQVHA